MIGDFHAFVAIYETQGMDAFIRALEAEQLQTPALKAAAFVLRTQDLARKLGRP